ncbi:MAG: rhodanese-like domain-containing protein [Saprospirales bacterium]|nr:rhodanese-like domain-containing protein [Saprospirales bacterium]
MKYFVLGVLISLVLLPSCQKEGKRKDADPQTLLTELSDQRRFASADQLAEWLIQKDPTLLLVDVRPHEEFDSYSLPGAINIPLANLLNPDEQARLNCEDYFIVFYANGTVLAEKAWMINRRSGCVNSFVLKGGLNEWTSTILQPQEPLPTASGSEWELFQFRKAAGQYFAGGSKALQAEPFAEEKPTPAPPVAKKTVPLQQKKAEVVEEEGC